GDAHAAFVIAEDLLDHGQSESGPLRLVGEKGLEDAFMGVRRKADARAVVPHNHPDLLILTPRAQLDAPPSLAPPLAGILRGAVRVAPRAIRAFPAIRTRCFGPC